MAFRQSYLVAIGTACALGTACQDALPGNPYDPSTDPSAQARGEVRGSVLLDDPAASPDVIGYELGAIAIKLRHGDEETTAGCGEGSSPQASATCDTAQRTLVFSFKDLRSGEYQVALTGVNPRYVPVNLQPFDLVPGEIVDVGSLRLVPFDIGGQNWTGRVVGVVELDGGGGARRVTLLRQGSSGIEEYAARRTGDDGAFEFSNVAPGAYAALAELEGFTPAYDTQVEIAPSDTPTEENTVELSGARALRLYPISGVIRPEGDPIAGRYYSSGTEVTLRVLEFGGMTEMRISTDPTYAGGALEFQPRSGSADLALPDVEGPIPIYAQFRLSAGDFSFSTSSYQTEVVRDTARPATLGLQVRGRSPASDGKIWLAAEGSTIGLDIDGFDSHSAVHYVALYHDQNNGAGDPAALAWTEQLSPEGRVRLTATETLTAGDGAKSVFVYLQDRAGNLSEASGTLLWVDTIAPEIEQLVVNQGQPVTGVAQVAVAITASDLNPIASMQVWEEGTAVPPPMPFQPASSVLLQPLDHQRTSRQINAVVWDIAGNPSLPAARTVTFDDRGELHGTLRVENAADGSPGTSGDVAAFVNGDERPVLFTETADVGVFDFVVSAVPAAGNLLLTMTKDGYDVAVAPSLVTSIAGARVEVGVLLLAAARGSIAGYAQAAGETVHTGISVEVQGTGLVGLTGVDGAFAIDGVPAGRDYTLVIRKDDQWSVETLTGVHVLANDVVEVSSLAAPVLLTRLAGSFAIEEGSYTNQRTVTLLVSYQDAVEYRAAESQDLSAIEYLGFAEQGCTARVGGGWACPFVLSDSDSMHHVYVQFSGPPTNDFESQPRSDSITLDRVAPTDLRFTVNDGAAYLNTLSVTLSLSGQDLNGIAQYQLAHRQTGLASELIEADWSSARPLPNAPFGELLPGTTEYRTVRVWARLIDVAGNVSAPALASFIHDAAAPTGGSITINGGASLTNSFTVTLNLTATDQSPIDMLIGDDRVPSNGTWEPFAASRVWTVPPAAQGTKTIFVAFRDAAGNRTQDYSDAITYDSIAPPTPVMTTSAGAATADPQITLAFTNRTADVAQIEVATNTGFANSVTFTSQAQVPFTLPDLDGDKMVYSRYIDAAGNRSELAALAIRLDRLAPELPALRVVSGQYTRVNRVQLELSALGASEMLLSATANCSSGSWVHFSTSGFVDVADPEGVKNISARYRDAAGNSTDCLPAQVTLDKSAPLLGSTPVRLSGLQIVLNSSQSAVEATYVRVDFDVTGASQMKISNQDGCGDVNWQDYAAITPSWRLLPNDGIRTVYAMFRDAAGNSTSQVSANVAVDSTGDVTGTIALEGSSVYDGLTFMLEERSFSHTMAGNRFTIANVLTKTYVPLRVSKAGYDDALLSSGVAVPAGGTVDVGSITLRRSRGVVEGYVRLADRSTHENILIELLNTGYSTQTNSAGYFIVEDVLVGIYDLVARRDGYTTATVPGVEVQSQLTTQVSTVGSPLLLSPQLGDFTINQGVSLYTTVPGVTLNLSYDDAVSFRASEDPTFADGLQEYATFFDAGCVTGTSTIDCPFTLSAGDGTKTVYVQFLDSASQPSLQFDSSIVLDTTPPSGGTVEINGGASVTNQHALQVAVSSGDANGVAQMRVSVDGVTWEGERSFQTPFVYSLDLAAADTSHCVHVQFRDSAGLWSELPAELDCIDLDTQRPTPGDPVLVIRDAQGNSLNDGLTSSASVLLEVNASGASEMMFSNQLSFAGAVWQPYDDGQQHFWTLIPGDGLRTVYVMFRDAAGNVAGDDGAYNASTTVNTVAPDPPVFTVDQGSFTNSRTVTLHFTNHTDETIYFISNRSTSGAPDLCYANDCSFTLPDVDGLHILTVRYRDPAGNEGQSTTASITLDRVVPTVLALAIDGGAVYSTSDSGLVMLSINGSDALSGVNRMRFSNDGMSWSAWQAYGQSWGPWTLASPSAQDDVVKSVYLQLDDVAGNVTAASSTSIHLDNVHPVASLVQINDNQSHTGMTSVTLTLVSSGASEMKISNGQGCSNGSWEAVAATRTWTLDGEGDGVQKYVSVELRDAAGNLSACIEDSIIVDTSTPSLPTVSIDGAALYNNSVGHTLQVTVSAVNAAEFRISEAADFSVGAAQWRSYPPAGAVSYTLIATADGEKTIHAQFRDAAQNTTAVVADSILHDTTAPNGGYVLIDNGAAYTKATDGRVVLYLGASDALSGVATVQLSNDDISYTSYDYATVISNWALASPSSVDGATRTVYVRYIDRAGNPASAVNDAITLDNVAPQNLAISVASGAAYTSSRSVTVDVTSTSSDVVEVALSNTALNCSTAAYGANTGTLQWALAGNDGAKTVYACARDAAGNSASANDGILLDSQPPTISVATAVGDSGEPAGYSYDATVTVNIVADDVTDEANLIGCVANNAAFDGASCNALPIGDPHSIAVTNWNLGAGEGVKAVYIKVYDRAGNAAVRSATITVDGTGPTGGDITLLEDPADPIPGNGYTNVAAIRVATPAAGASQRCVYGDLVGAATCVWETCTDSRSVTLVTTSPGTKTVNVQYRDDAGHTAGPYTATIFYDGAVPTSPTLTINGGLSHTASAVVTLALSAVDANSGLNDMRLVNGSVVGGNWEAYSTVRAWTLDSATDGNKSVTVQYRDRAGNTAQQTAGIVLDSQNPTISLFTASGNNSEPAGYSRDTTVALAVTADDVTDGAALDYCISNTASFDNPTCGDLSAGSPHQVSVASWTVATGGGQATVYLKVYDRAGNTAYASATIVVDGVGPSGASVTIVENASDATPANGYTRYTGVTLSSSVSGADEICVLGPYSGTPTDCGEASAGWDTYASSTMALTLNTGEGTKTLSVYFRDLAHNTAGPYPASVVLDTVGPSSCSVALTGSVLRVSDEVAIDSTTLTYKPDVRASVTASDATSPIQKIMLSNSAAFSGATWTTFTSSPMTNNWLLAGGASDGETRPVYLRCLDAADNQVDGTGDSIVLDNVAPTAAYVEIAGDAAYIFSYTGVSLTLSGEGASYAKYSTSSLFTGATWDASPWADATISFSSLEGTKRVYAKYRDNAGNQSAVATDTVIYDAAVPVAPSALNVNETPGADPDFVNQITATLTWTASTSTDVALYEVRIDGVIYEAPLTSFTTSALADGDHTWNVRAVDRADRSSGWAVTPSDLVFTVDTAAPSAPRFTPITDTIVDAASIALSLAVTSTDPGNHFKEYQTRTTSSPSWTGQGSNTSYTLTLQSNAVNVLRVRAVDRAGNASDEDFVVITEDSNRPGGVVNLNADAGNGEITMTWSRPTSNGDDVVGYLVYYGPANATGNPALYNGVGADQGMSPIDVGNNTNFRLSGLALGTPVFVGVIAYDAIGGGTFVEWGQPLRPNIVAPRIMSTTAISGAAPRAVAYADGVAFVAAGCPTSSTCSTAGLYAYDVSDPTAPVLLDSVTSSSYYRYMWDIAVLGNYAYVADGTYLRTFDISDPTNISLASSVYVSAANSATWAVGLAVSPGYLYVAVENNGLRIYSLATPTTPSLTGSRTPTGALTSATCVAVQGDYAYVCNRGGGAVTINITNKAAPALAGAVGSGGFKSWNVQVANDHVYLSKNGAFEVYAMPDPSVTLTDDEYLAQRSGLQARGFIVAGPYAYVANEDAYDGVIAVDVLGLDRLDDSPGAVPLIGRVDTTSAGGYETACTLLSTCTRSNDDIAHVRRLAVAGVYILEANKNAGLLVHRISRPVALAEIARFGLVPAPYSDYAENALALYGHLVAYSHYNSVAAVDISVPYVPVSVGTAGTGGYTTSTVSVVGDRIYYAQGNGIQQYRFTPNPAAAVAKEAPEWLDGNGSRYPQRALVRWPYAYLIDSSETIYAKSANLITVDLRTMAQVGSAIALNTGTGNWNSDLAYYGDRLYVTAAAGSKVAIVNLSTASTPTYNSANDLVVTSATGLSVQGTKLYLTANNQLRIYSLASNRDAPTLLNESMTPGMGRWIQASGRYLFSADGPQGVVADISNPAAPILIGFAGNISLEMAVLAVGKHMFIADRHEMAIIELE